MKKKGEYSVELTYQGDSKQRLDKYLVSCLTEFSRTRLQNLIKAGEVTVNGKVLHKSGIFLEDGAVVRVRIPPPAPTTLVPESIPLELIYENDDMIVINKPAGMVVHPSAGHSSGTLVHAALAHAPQMEGVGGEIRPGVVHRLDKNTSGVIILAKNDRAHIWLQEQFRSRTVEKKYIALVDGQPPTPKGRVEAAIGRDPVHRKRMSVMPDHKGRHAISEYYTLESFVAHSLLKVHPITGRTHQIRVHLSFLDCPVVGDVMYGRRNPSLPLKRHFLHAVRLTFIPFGDTLPRTFETPLADELLVVLDELRKNG